MPEAMRKEFDQASAVLRKALGGNSMAAMESCVRHPELTMPRVRASPATRGVLPAQPIEIGPKFGVSGDLLLTTLRLRDGTHRPVAMEKKKEGYLLDWESLTGWGESTFTELLTRPNSKVVLMRVMCSPTSAKAPFEDAGGVSLVLSHPAEQTTLSAYVPAELLKAHAAGKSLTTSRNTPFTLRLLTEKASAEQGWVRVMQIICIGWVTDE